MNTNSVTKYNSPGSNTRRPGEVGPGQDGAKVDAALFHHLDLEPYPPVTRHQLLFSYEEAALEVQKEVCLCVRVSVCPQN